MLTTLETIFITVCIVFLSLAMAVAIVLGVLFAIGLIMEQVVEIKKSARELRDIKELDRKREDKC